ncbi:MAG: glycosyltransferase family 2 protein [Alphaproteobacteria bacterium]|nr:MAG: glycosyltransferase family 2 protein [Alphaproteobacteria bacterium]
MDKQANAPAVAVVIPYYQREPGILRRAVQSILGQDYHASLHLIIVDDASPHPAKTELAEVAMPAHIHLRILTQANAGPGAARNRGMDEARSLGADIVAFLDSDDSWTPDHLGRGVAAMHAGFDIYVANWRLFGRDEDAHRARAMIDARAAAPGALADTLVLTCPFLEQQLRGPIMKLSSLVFRPARFADPRFRSDLRHASEDNILAFELALFDPKVLVSTRIEVITGHGVNIYESAAWGTLARHQVFLDQLRAMRLAARLVRQRPDARQAVAAQRRRLRRSAVEHLLYMFGKKGARHWRPMISLCRADPRVPMAAPAAMLAIMGKWLRRAGQRLA